MPTWIPTSQQGFKDKVDGTIAYLFPKRDALGFGATTDNGKWLDGTFSPAVTAFVTAFNAWKDPKHRSHVEVTAMNQAREALESVYRRLALILKGSVSVSDLDLDEMGIPPRERDKPTPSPVATLPPKVNVILERVGVVAIEFENAAPETDRRPDGQHGVEACYATSETPIVDYYRLVSSSFSTRSPLEIEFPGHDRGKTVYFAARWENNVGKKGPFTEIFSTMIP